MIRPLQDWLVIEQIGQPPGKFGDIFIPDTERLSQATGSYARVLAAGPACLVAKKGSKVWVKAYGSHLAGDEIIHEGKTVTMIREKHVEGIVVE
jgi:co-chaperonin GroES (HSP10)